MMRFRHPQLPIDLVNISCIAWRKSNWGEFFVRAFSERRDLCGSRRLYVLIYFLRVHVWQLIQTRLSIIWNNWFLKGSPGSEVFFGTGWIGFLRRCSGSQQEIRERVMGHILLHIGEVLRDIDCEIMY